MATKAKKGELNDKQLAFCREYIQDFNGTQAAIRAGYSKRTAKEQASDLLTKLNVRQKVSELSSAVLKDRIDITRARVVNELEAAAFSEAVETRDKLRALELLGKYAGLFVDRSVVEHSGEVRVVFNSDGKAEA